jgi:hypothetical protein
MKSTSEKLADGTAWSLGGLVLFIVALFSVGHIVVLFLLMALPFLVGYLAINAIFGKRPVYLEALAAKKKAAVSAKKVEVKVIHAEGICPMGYGAEIGASWVLNGKTDGMAPLCPKAEGLIIRSAEEVRHRKTSTASVVDCIGNGHMMEFELKLAEEPALVTVGN